MDKEKIKKEISIRFIDMNNYIEDDLWIIYEEIIGSLILILKTRNLIMDQTISIFKENNNEKNDN